MKKQQIINFIIKLSIAPLAAAEIDIIWYTIPSTCHALALFLPGFGLSMLGLVFLATFYLTTPHKRRIHREDTHQVRGRHRRDNRSYHRSAHTACHNLIRTPGASADTNTG